MSYALAISPLITDCYLQDPTFNEFTFKFNKNNCKISDNEIQEEFSKFIKGENISREFFYEIGINLKNQDMIKKWSKSEKLTNEKIIKSFKVKRTIFHNRTDEFKKEIDYIIEHLEEMEGTIKELSDEELIFLLRNDKFQVEKEDIIWEIVKTRIESQNPDEKNKINLRNKSILMGMIEVKYLNQDCLKEYIEKVEEENIESEPNIFKKIKKILLNNLDNLKLEGKLNRNSIKIDPVQGEIFKGIIHYLKENNNQNIFDKGIISITASSTEFGSPKQVIDYNWSGFWASDTSPGNWLEFDFKDLKVKINGYSLKTYADGQNWIHLKNWALQGSQDRNQWIEIDRKINNSDLNGSRNKMYYSISGAVDSFRYIRLKSTGLNHCPNSPYNNRLGLTNIEFYGEIMK